MYYHYTTVLHLPFILNSGKLMPSRRDAHGDHRHGLLWFSSNSMMEPTAIKSGTMLVRFGSSDARIRPWREMALAVGYSAAVMRRLEASGRKMKAVPSHWAASREPLAIDSMSTEALVGDVWRQVDVTFVEVQKVDHNVLGLMGPGGLVAIVGRRKTAEGYYAYGTNAAIYRPENLLVDSEPVEEAS